jgi:hypothetical protein
MPFNLFSGKFESYRNRVLVVLTITLPLVPALIAYLMKSTAGATGLSSSDAPILSAWTYLQVAVIAYFVFLSWEGPPNYLTAYTAIIVAHGAFMQRLGEPIGLGLARLFGGVGMRDPLAPAAASFIHHLLVGAVTWGMARLITEMTGRCAQPTQTLRIGVTTNPADGDGAGVQSVEESPPVQPPEPAATGNLPPDAPERQPPSPR